MHSCTPAPVPGKCPAANSMPPQHQPPPEMVAAWILQAQHMILTLSNVLCSSHHSCSNIRISLCSWAAFTAAFCFIDFSKPLRGKGKASERAISYREVILAGWAPGSQVGEEKHCSLFRGWSCNRASSSLSVIFVKTIVKPFHHFVPGEERTKLRWNQCNFARSSWKNFLPGYHALFVINVFSYTY